MIWMKRDLPQQFYKFVDSGYGKYTATALCRAGIESIEAAKEYLESEEIINPARIPPTQFFISSTYVMSYKIALFQEKYKDSLHF